MVDLVSKTSIITENFTIKVRGMNESFETVRFHWARFDQDTIDKSCRKSNLKFAHFSKRFFLKIFISKTVGWGLKNLKYLLNLPSSAHSPIYQIKDQKKMVQYQS